MPNKIEVWQRIISYCDAPEELAKASKFIYRTAHLDTTKAMWILRHPDTPLAKRLLNQQILVMLLKSEIDYYNHSAYLDSETENLLTALLEQKDKKHFVALLNMYQPTHRLQKLLHLVSTLLKQDPIEFDCLDALLQWSKQEFNGKLLHLTLKANCPSVSRYLLQQRDVLSELDWYDLKESQFLQLLQILEEERLITMDSVFVTTDLLEVIISRDLASCLDVLFKAGLKLQDWELHLAVIKNSVNTAKLMLENGADPHVDNDICLLDAASFGYTRLVHLFSRHADKQLLQKALYCAIQGDQPEVVALLLEMPNTPVKCDQQAFYLASTKHGVKKEASRQLTVLELLLASSSDVVYLSYVGKNAVKMVSDYCKQVFTNIATVSK
jgi:hypothetical protein